MFSNNGRLFLGRFTRIRHGRQRPPPLPGGAAAPLYEVFFSSRVHGKPKNGCGVYHYRPTKKYHAVQLVQYSCAVLHSDAVGQTNAGLHPVSIVIPKVLGPASVSSRTC